jgi:hypothetical protein
MDEQSGSGLQSQQQYQYQQQKTYAYGEQGQPMFNPIKPIQRYQQNFNQYNSNYLNSNFQYQQYQQQLFQNLNSSQQHQHDNVQNNPSNPEFYYQTQYQSNPNYQNTDSPNASSNIYLEMTTYTSNNFTCKV